MNCLRKLISCGIWTLLMIPLYSFAQHSKIDSLNEVLLKVKDTQKVNTLIEIGNEYKSKNNYGEQLAAYFKALQFSEEIGNKEAMFSSLYAIANFYTFKNGGFDLSLEYAKKAEIIAEQLNNKTKLYKIYDLIGGYIYFNKQNYTKAFEYGNKMMEIVESMNVTVKVRDMQMWIGDVYRLAKKPDSAIILYSKALAISRQIKDTQTIASCLHGIGIAYGQEGNKTEQINYYLQSIKVAESANLPTESFALNTAFAYLDIKKYEEALLYAKSSFDSYQKTNNQQKQLQCYRLLTNIYYAKADYKSAYESQVHVLRLKDFLNSNETESKMNEVQNDYKIEKQVKEIDLLQAKSKLEKTVRNGLAIGALLFIIIAFLLFNKYRHQKRSEVKMGLKNNELTQALQELKATQSQLIQSEKMAWLGELTAGIAHEIQNPLNFVNNFSEVNKEMIEEAVEEIDKGNIEDVKSILSDIKDNSEKINHHGKRADAIVKGMLQHSQSSAGKNELTGINALCDEYVRLSYHGLRAKVKTFNTSIKTDYDNSIGKINIIPQDIGRVILNLLTNAFYAVNERKQQQSSDYEPIVSISTKKVAGKIQISVKDNGNGIPQKIVDKIFQPFFTTKPTGQGTGLGLSLSYDIVKVHGGEIKVESREGEGTAFIIQLPFV